MAKSNLHLRIYKASEDVNDRAAEDQIFGEVTQIYHEGEIQLESWNWTHVRGVDGQSKASTAPSTLKFSKLLDASTVPLLGYLKSSVPLSLVVINMIDDPQESPFGLTAQFFKVRVKSYSLSAAGQGSAGQLSENWELEYQRAKFGYWMEYHGEFQASGEASFEVTRRWGQAMPTVQDKLKKKDKDKDKNKDKNAGTSADSHDSGGSSSGDGGHHGSTTRDGWSREDHNTGGRGIAQPRKG